MSLDLSVFLQQSNHDHDFDLLLPDHLPEGIEGAGQGCLRRNELLRAKIALDIVGIDIVRVLIVLRKQCQ